MRQAVPCLSTLAVPFTSRVLTRLLGLTVVFLEVCPVVRFLFLSIACVGLALELILILGPMVARVARLAWATLAMLAALTLSLPRLAMMTPWLAARARSPLRSLRDGVCLRKPVVQLRLTGCSRDLPRANVVAAVLSRATWVLLQQSLLRDGGACCVVPAARRRLTAGSRSGRTSGLPKS